MQRHVYLCHTPFSVVACMTAGLLEVSLLHCCRDTEALDTSLGNTVSSFLTCAVSVAGALLVVLAVTPAVLFAVVPLFLAYRYVQVRVMPDRAETISRGPSAPIPSHNLYVCMKITARLSFRVLSRCREICTTIGGIEEAEMATSHLIRYELLPVTWHKTLAA